MALHPILDVCDRETGYAGGGRRQDPWRRQTAARKQLITTLKEILETARKQRYKSGRHGGGVGDRETEESEDGAGSGGSRYAGTETGDAQVGE